MISIDLLLKIFDAASMQRWNDQIRAFEITELDKQAHKMIVAYILGKFSESNYLKTDVNSNNLKKHKNYNKVDWIKIIEYGLFEFLQRIILTDLKPPLFYEIKKDKEKYKKLNQWVYSRILPTIIGLGENFCNRFYCYILDYYNSDENKEDIDINKQIIGAAHFYVTKWEFYLIARFNPYGYQVDEIKKSIETQQERYKTLKSLKFMLNSKNLTSFINICGQLRFQIRWSHIYRVPKTSVLGHMLIVAIFSYLFSYILGLDTERAVNNYFTGLFHDLPEVLTRDIINPVKKSVEGLDDLIKEYEKKEMEKRIYKLLPKEWLSDFKMYTENEFTDNKKRDGTLVKACDDLAAYIEAYLCKKNGINNISLKEAMDNLKNKYLQENYSNILGINFSKFYLDLIK